MQLSLRKQPSYQMILKDSHLVVIIRIVSTGLHDCNITHSNFSADNEQKKLLKKLCIRTSVVISCILNLIKGSLSSINPLLLSLFRFLVDILTGPNSMLLADCLFQVIFSSTSRARISLLCEFVQVSSNI